MNGGFLLRKNSECMERRNYGCRIFDFSGTE